MVMKTKEIGADFSLPLSSLFQRTFPWRSADSYSHHVFLSSGRDGLHYLISALKLSSEDCVLLPSYLCQEVLNPFRQRGVKVVFYQVNENLNIVAEDFKQKISNKIKLAVIIHYFGFPQNAGELLEFCRNHKVPVLEDRVQAMLTKHPKEQGDFTLSSFRKFFPVTDGAVLSFKEAMPLELVPLIRSLSHKGCVWSRFIGLLTENYYEKTGLNFLQKLSGHFFSRSYNLRSIYPKPAPMSSIAFRLMSGVNEKNAVKQRRENYMVYLKTTGALRKIKPVFETLPEEVCPLRFPVRVSDGKRDELHRRLKEQKINTFVEWELPREVSADFASAWNVSKSILSLPVDQRYEPEDMEAVVSCIRQWGKN